MMVPLCFIIVTVEKIPSAALAILTQSWPRSRAGVEQRIDLRFGSLNVMLNPQTLFSILRFATVNIVDQMKAHNLAPPAEDTAMVQRTTPAPEPKAVRSCVSCLMRCKSDG